MAVVEWFIGFHNPSLRNGVGQIDFRCWFGHCHVWGYTHEDTWFFIDPRANGATILVDHRHDEVLDQLAGRYGTCDSILKIAADDFRFSVPFHGLLTCASLCGAFLGVRAFLPSGLRRKLLAKGAEEVHEAEGRPRPESPARARPADGATAA